MMVVMMINPTLLPLSQPVNVDSRPSLELNLTFRLKKGSLLLGYAISGQD